MSAFWALACVCRRAVAACMNFVSCQLLGTQEAREQARFCESTLLSTHTTPVSRVKLAEEVKVLERAKDEMQLEESFVNDKYRQLKAENERLHAEIGKYRARLGNATEDYVSGSAEL